MIDMLAVNSGRVTNLTRVTYIVMDEADRMFDLGKLDVKNLCLDYLLKHFSKQEFD